MFDYEMQKLGLVLNVFILEKLLKTYLKENKLQHFDSINWKSILKCKENYMGLGWALNKEGTQ